MTNFRLQISKLKEFADDNFEFDENGGKFSKRLENTVEKGDFSFSHSVFKRFLLQTRKNQGLFGKGLNYVEDVHFYGLLDVFCCTCHFHISP